jgi:hypothetical protein
MSGLDDEEAVSSPEIGERTVAVERGEIVRYAVAVREKDDGEVAPSRWRGNAYLQVRGAPWNV